MERAITVNAANVFGGEGSTSAPPPIGIKVLHAKLDEWAVENDFLEGALIKVEFKRAGLFKRLGPLLFEFPASTSQRY